MSAGAGSVGGLWLQLRASTGEFERDMTRARASADRTERSLGDTDERARRLEGGFLAAASGAVALGYGLARIVGSGAAVEKQLSVIQATSGATEGQMASLSDEIQRVNTVLPVGLRDATAAAKELSFAGQDVDDMMGSLAPTAELAAASTLTVADSARFTASMMNQFGLDADQTASVADAAAGTFANSAVSLEEIGHAAEYAGTAFAAAGQDVATLNSFIGILGDAGIRGSRAGTALRQSVNRLSSPTGKAADALAQMGLSADDFTDSEGDMRDMVDVYGMIGKRLEGMGQQEKIAAMADIFGQRAAPAALELAEAAADGEAQAKRLAIRASELGGALSGLSDLDNESLKERNAELRKMAKREGLGQEATLQISADMNQMDALNRLRGLSDRLSEEQLTAQIQAGFAVGEDTAQQLAFEMESGTDLQALNKRLNEAQTTGGLTAAQMETVGGKIEYIKGSLEGISFSMFQGVKPLLTPLLEGGMALADILSENEGVTKALGAGLFLLAGALAAAAVGLGAMYANLAITNLRMESARANTLAYRGAKLASAGASRIAAGAQATYTAALNGNLIALGRKKAAQVADTTSTYASAAAQRVNAAAHTAGRASMVAQMLATNAATSARSAYTTATNVSTAATYRERAATAANTAMKWAARQAGMAYAGAEYAIATARNSSALAAARSRAASAGLTAARYAGRGAAYASAGAEWGLTTARNSSMLAAVRARATQAGLSASYYAGQTAAYGAAAGQYALSTASGVASGALGAASVAASTLWAALGPLGLLALGITAIIAGDALGLPILDGAIDSTIGMVNWLLGPLGGLEGVASAVGAGFGFVAGSVEWLYNQAMALVGGLDATQAAMMAIPGLGLAMWLFDLAGGMDTVRAGMDALGTGFDYAAAGVHAFLNPVETAHRILTNLTDIDVSDIPLIGGLLDKGIKAGQSLAEGAAQGAKGKKGLFGKAAGALAGAAAKYLPSSDAQKGPLSNLSGRGKAVPRMLATHAQKNKGVVGSAMDTLGALMSGRLPNQLAAPAVGQPTPPGVPAPQTTPAAAPAVGQPTPPGVPAPSVDQPQVPTTVIDAITGALPSPGDLLPGGMGLGDELTTRIKAVAGQRPAAGELTPPSTPRTTIGAVAGGTPAASVFTPASTPRQRVAAEAGRAPPESAFVPPTAPAARVRADPDTRPLRAQMDALSPQVRAQAQVRTDSTLAPDVNAPAAGIEPEANAVRSALADAGSVLRDRLVAGGQQLAGVVGGLSIPGTDMTVGGVGKTAADATVPVRQQALGTVERTLGVDMPDPAAVLGTLGIEEPPQAGVDMPETLPVGRPPRERSTPPGGFGAMGPAQPADVSVSPSITARAPAPDIPAALASPQGPPGPRGPPAAASTGAGPTAAPTAVAGGGVGAGMGAGATSTAGGQPAPTVGGDPLAASRSPTAPIAETPGETVEPPTPTPITPPGPERSPDVGERRELDAPESPDGQQDRGRGRGQEQTRGRGQQGRTVVIKSVDFGDTNITVPKGQNVDENALAEKIRKDRRQDIDMLERKISGEVELATNEGGAPQGDG